jgi:glucosylceramidase
MLIQKFSSNLILGLPLFLLLSCGKTSSGTGGTIPTPPVPPTPPPAAVNEVDFWLTKGDQSLLLQKQTGVISFAATSPATEIIEVDSTQVFQTIDGFGYTITGGSVSVINGLGTSAKADLLRELFSTDATSIGVSYLRISIGASDLSASVYTYDDVPGGTNLEACAMI